MKLNLSELIHLVARNQARNILILAKFILVLITMVTIYSILFHFLMLHEGRSFSWITGFYWTLTVMSTLGFGDITFATDLGRLFSIIVLLSGIVFLMTMLPFTFIQFFYLPWLEAQAKARAPRQVDENTRGHVILTDDDPVTISLAQKLRQYRHDYVIVVEDVQRALDLKDADFNAVVGELTDSRTYGRLNVTRAALVFANVDDMINTDIAFTVREITADVPIAVNADSDDSVDILHLAGGTHVFQFKTMLGQALARRVLGSTTITNVIGRIESLRQIPLRRKALSRDS